MYLILVMLLIMTDKEKILNEPFEIKRRSSEEERLRSLILFGKAMILVVKEPSSYNEYHKQYEEGRQEANYNRNPYPIGSKEYISFNQGVASVLDLTND